MTHLTRSYVSSTTNGGVSRLAVLLRPTTVVRLWVDLGGGSAETALGPGPVNRIGRHVATVPV